MPSHTHWAWWDHFDDYWDRHWDYPFYHTATRPWHWPLGSAFDLNFCTRNIHHWHTHLKSEALSSSTSPPAWCHSSCLTDNVTIETGNGPNTMDKGTFKVVIDVHHFRPDELVLKVRNQDTILLHGKLSDDRANKGFACITREFTRRYKLPRNYDATQANATISTDGILTVVVPAPPQLDDVERVVEIKPTGVYFGSEDTKALEGEEEKKKLPDLEQK